MCSRAAGSLDVTDVYRLSVGGIPPEPFDARELMTFSDGNYLCRFDPLLNRADIPDPIAPVTGVVQAGSTLNVVVTTGGLYLVGDDMAGMRAEIVHTDGTVDVRTIVANTATNITLDMPLTASPIGGTWYVCGIPAFWRSWVDHGGDPTLTKTLLHLFLGYGQKLTGQVIDVSVAGGDFPTAVDRAYTVDMGGYRSKTMVSWTARFFTYEVANSKPDERFVLTYVWPELIPAERRFA